ncbi:hypothetical protein OHC33_000126 [Knufia fluminis]|uniref:Sulfotransferase n=1 Tax=Knufia fluminis TaxID=191047 RepID=A0AAN8ELB8_9EURO|nr:hypothetical protein OHC33_000126 [Knufia fluminis]
MAMEQTSGTTTRPVYVIDSPRTCSQVFGKLWMAHPQLEHIFMSMMGPSIYGPESLWRGRKASDKIQESYTDLTETANASGTGMFQPTTYQDGAAKIEESVKDILEKGKTPWIKDHSMCIVPPPITTKWLSLTPQPPSLLANPTAFTTPFLDSVTPIFLIRHPTLSIPSFYRKQRDILHNAATDASFRILTSLEWTRLVFDSYLRRRGLPVSVSEDPDVTAYPAEQVPLLIESVDLIYHTQAVAERVCDYVGIDKGGVQYEWEPTPEEEWPPSALARAFFQDMLESTGIQRAEKPAEMGIDLDRLTAEWTEEFDEETARTLRGLVEREIPNYEYLRRFKWVV